MLRELLDKEILEEGFELSCTNCAYKAWYRLDKVGHSFECTRCYRPQSLSYSPVLLYKLREVYYQGLNQNMQVPLLAINFLRKASKRYFDWLPDSDLYWMEGKRIFHKNADIICYVDGKIYLGEAKSNDYIEDEQLAFYKKIARLLPVERILFATSQEHWKEGMKEKFDLLTQETQKPITLLTKGELYT